MNVRGIRRRLRLLTALLLVFMMVGAPVALAEPPDHAGPGRYVVVFKDGVDPRPAAQALGRLHGFIPVHVYGHALRGFAAVIPPARLAALAGDPRVAYIEPDLVMHALADTVPTGVLRVGADSHPLFTPGAAVKVDVAVIDTGIDLDHPDLNVAGNVTFVRRTSSGNDDNGHGSHVAGTIAAKYDGSGVVGIAPGARLWAVKVLDRRGSGYMSDIVAGVDWVAQHAGTIEVANMSLGGQGTSSALRTAIQNSVGLGVVYVVAAGNSEVDVYGNDGTLGTSDDYIPAAYPEVATVSALADSDGKAGGTGSNTGYGPDDTLATFSNYSRLVVGGNPVSSSGAAIDVAAPGVDIYSTYKNGGYATGSGTSMAAPHVAGIVALYLAEHGRASTAAGVYAVRQAIIDAGQPQTEWGPADTRDPDANHEDLALAAQPAPPVPAPGVSIDPESASGEAFAGESASYVFTVTNAGEADGQYSAETSPGAMVTPASFSIAAGLAVDVTVTHTVPTGTDPGTIFSGTLTVTEAGGAKDTAAFTTRALGYAVEVTAAVHSGTAGPGETVTYEFTVKNTGTENDTYNVGVTGAGWGVALDQSTLTLVAGASATVTVSHTVPADAADGDFDARTLTATSSGSSATASATFTTTCQTAPPPSELGVQVAFGGTPTPGANIEVLVAVTDAGGGLVPAANVSLEFVTQGKTYYASGTTNDRGLFKARFKTSKTDGFPWTATATASKDGAAGTGSTVYP